MENGTGMERGCILESEHETLDDFLSQFAYCKASTPTQLIKWPFRKFNNSPPPPQPRQVEIDKSQPPPGVRIVSPYFKIPTESQSNVITKVQQSKSRTKVGSINPNSKRKTRIDQTRKNKSQQHLKSMDKVVEDGQVMIQHPKLMSDETQTVINNQVRRRGTHSYDDIGFREAVDDTELDCLWDERQSKDTETMGEASQNERLSSNENLGKHNPQLCVTGTQVLGHNNSKRRTHDRRNKSHPVVRVVSPYFKIPTRYLEDSNVIIKVQEPRSLSSHENFKKYDPQQCLTGAQVGSINERKRRTETQKNKSHPGGSIVSPYSNSPPGCQETEKVMEEDNAMIEHSKIKGNEMQLGNEVGSGVRSTRSYEVSVGEGYHASKQGRMINCETEFFKSSEFRDVADHTDLDCHTKIRDESQIKDTEAICKISKTESLSSHTNLGKHNPPHCVTGIEVRNSNSKRKRRTNGQIKKPHPEVRVVSPYFKIPTRYLEDSNVIIRVQEPRSLSSHETLKKYDPQQCLIVTQVGSNNKRKRRTETQKNKSHPVVPLVSSYFNSPLGCQETGKVMEEDNVIIEHSEIKGNEMQLVNEVERGSRSTLSYEVSVEKGYHASKQGKTSKCQTEFLMSCEFHDAVDDTELDCHEKIWDERQIKDTEPSSKINKTESFSSRTNLGGHNPSHCVTGTEVGNGNSKRKRRANDQINKKHPVVRVVSPYFKIPARYLEDSNVIIKVQEPRSISSYRNMKNYDHQQHLTGTEAGGINSNRKRKTEAQKNKSNTGAPIVSQYINSPLGGQGLEKGVEEGEIMIEHGKIMGDEMPVVNEVGRGIKRGLGSDVVVKVDSHASKQRKGSNCGTGCIKSSSFHEAVDDVNHNFHRTNRADSLLIFENLFSQFIYKGGGAEVVGSQRKDTKAMSKHSETKPIALSNAHENSKISAEDPKSQLPPRGQTVSPYFKSPTGYRRTARTAKRVALSSDELEAYERRTFDNSWHPPRSPHGLLQEDHAYDPWRVLVICILLNKTTGAQVEKVLPDFFSLCPDAKTATEVATEDIQKIIMTLGIQNKKPAMIQRFSREYLEKDWIHVIELHGIGKYAADAYALFVTGKWDQVNPEDHKLKPYWEFLQKIKHTL